MKIFPVLGAVLVATFCYLSAVAEGQPASALPAEAQQMLDDLGTPEVQLRNNDKIQPCIHGGSKKITVSLLENTTIFSAEYSSCREPGSTRDGYFEVIVRNGEIIGQSSKRSISGELFDTVQVGDVAKVKELISKKADVNYTDTIPTTDGGSIEGWTPLMSAAVYGNTEIVKLLIKSGAWVNFMNSRAVTALWLAVGNGNLDVVKMLVVNKAYINNRNSEDVTPLMHASMNGHFNVVKFLLGAKADMNIVHKDGDSALMLALANGHSEVARLLIDSGANIDIQNRFGVTALMIAIAEDNEEMVRKLVEKNANFSANTNDGKTALDVAKSKGNEKIIKMLRLHL